MANSLTCPQGHKWVAGHTRAEAERCPVCGGEGSRRVDIAEMPTLSQKPDLANLLAETATVLPSSAGPPPAVRRPEIPGYELLAEIGRGGMGVVYKARHIKLDRPVALKMVLSGGYASENDLIRFRTEGEAVARLRHPHVVQIYEVGEHAGLPYCALEFISGGSLSIHLNGTPVPPTHAAELVETLARAIHAAHQAGIIHRDLKPANILLEGQGIRDQGLGTSDSPIPNLQSLIPKITDFGLAKKLDSADGPTATGAVMGTPSYMAPEQAGGKGKEVGPAADIYALGAILYELLTGRPPFKAPTPLDTIMQVVSDEPVRPRQLQPRLARDLETICLKCLEKDPRKRYATAADLADDLRRWHDHSPIHARRIGPIGRMLRWCRRHPGIAAVSVAALLILTALSFVYALSIANENRKTRLALFERDAENEWNLDLLAHGQYEQAVSMLLSNKPGRRWESIRLINEAQKLASRQRWVARHPDGYDVTINPGADLPSRAAMRQVAVDALLIDDARLLKQFAVGHSMGGLLPEITPDGKWALSVWMELGDGSAVLPKFGLRLTDLADNRVVLEKDSPVALAAKGLSPDGRLLAFSGLGFDGVSLIELSQGTLRQSLPRLNLLQGMEPIKGAEIVRFIFSPDCRFLIGIAHGGKEFDIFLWDLHNLPASRHLARVTAPIQSVSFRADSRVLACPLDGNKISLHDLVSNEPATSIELPLKVSVPSGESAYQHLPMTFLWSPTEHILAVLCNEKSDRGAIVFWDAENQTEKARWRGDFDLDNVVLSFHPSGKHLFVGSSDGTIRGFDIENQRETVRIDEAHFMGVGSLHWQADGALLSHGFSVSKWELSEGSLRSSIAHAQLSIDDVTFGPDGKSVAVLDQNEKHTRVALVNRLSGKVEREFTTSAPLRQPSLVFRPDGQELALASLQDTVVWNTLTGQEILRRQPMEQKLRRWFVPRFTDDGKLLIVKPATTVDEKLTVLDIITGQEIGPGVVTPKGALFIGGPGDIVLNHAGTMLAFGPSKYTPSRDPIQIWNVSSGEKVGELSAPSGEGSAGTQHVGFSDDGKWLLQVAIPLSYNKSVDSHEPLLRMWNVSSCESAWQARCPVGPTAVTFSLDSQVLAVGYQNGVVELRRVATGEKLFHWRFHSRKDIKHLAFAPDGAYVASSDGRAPIHMLHLAALKRALAEIGLDW